MCFPKVAYPGQGARKRLSFEKMIKLSLIHISHSVHEALVAVLSGGLLFGAVFMATDYVTSPFTLKGKLVYGVALGIEMCIRDRPCMPVSRMQLHRNKPDRRKKR